MRSVLRARHFGSALWRRRVLDESGRSCSELGFTHIRTDPIFHGFELYWKGGAAAFAAWGAGFGAPQPSLLSDVAAVLGLTAEACGWVGRAGAP